MRSLRKTECVQYLAAEKQQAHSETCSECFGLQKKVTTLEEKKNEDGDKDSFPLSQQFVTSSEVDFTHKLKSVFEEHVTQLSDWFEKYFPEDMEKFVWILDPLTAKAPSEFTSAQEENLIELSSDKTLTTKFGSMEITEFWISVKNEYLCLVLKLNES